MSKSVTTLEVASELSIETRNLSEEWRSDVEVRISPAKNSLLHTFLISSNSCVTTISSRSIALSMA